MAAAKKQSKASKAADHSFTLVLGGAAEAPEELAEALYESGCDDAMLGSRDGVVYLDFDRSSVSLLEAVLTAIADVHRANTGMWVSRVEPDDLVTASEIARRVGRSRESIRQLIQGERGPGEFPPPIANLRRKSPIWRWSDVATWFDQKIGGIESSLVADAADVAAVNAALELQRNARNIAAINRLWRSGSAGPAFQLTNQPRTRSVPGKRRRAAAKKKA